MFFTEIMTTITEPSRKVALRQHQKVACDDKKWG